MTTKYPPPSPQYVAARHHGGDQTPKLVVMHSTVSPCAIGGAHMIAHMFAVTDEAKSAHYVVDPAETVQCVHDHTVAYHCGYNQDSVGVEMCEYPSWNLARWVTRPHRRMRARAVNLVAKLCLAYGIPPYFVTAGDMLAGKRGVTTHRAMTRAYHRSTHWDPGAWPRRAFMRAVRARMAELKAAAR